MVTDLPFNLESKIKETQSDLVAILDEINAFARTIFIGRLERGLDFTESSVDLMKSGKDLSSNSLGNSLEITSSEAAWHLVVLDSSF